VIALFAKVEGCRWRGNNEAILPLTSASQFVGVFEELEQNGEKYGVARSYNICVLFFGGLVHNFGALKAQI